MKPKSLSEMRDSFLNDASTKIDRCFECGFHSVTKLEDGFDAGVKAHAELVHGLVEALQFYNKVILYQSGGHSAGPCSEENYPILDNGWVVAQEALTKYKALTGEG